MNKEVLSPRFHFSKLREMGFAALRFVGEKVDDAMFINFDDLEEPLDV